MRACAKLVKTQRRELGLSQKQLSLLVGYSSGQFVSNIERKTACIPPSRCGKFAKALGVPFEVVREAITQDFLKSLRFK